MKGTEVLTLSASNLERMTLRLSTYYNASLAAEFLCLNLHLSLSDSSVLMHAFELNFELSRHGFIFIIQLTTVTPLRMR